MPVELIELADQISASRYMSRSAYVIELLRKEGEAFTAQQKEKQGENYNSLVNGGDTHRIK